MCTVYRVSVSYIGINVKFQIKFNVGTACMVTFAENVIFYIHDEGEFIAYIVLFYWSTRFIALIDLIGCELSTLRNYCFSHITNRNSLVHFHLEVLLIIISF